MSVTLTFHTIKEKTPLNGEIVAYFRKFTSFDSYGFEFVWNTVEYCWFEVDSEGIVTGNQICYEDGDDVPEAEEEGYRYELKIMIDGYVVSDDEDVLWMSEDDFFSNLPKY